ncbi:MAG: hypothetical protein O7G86_13690, partial [Gammaproteobacteria bacterium]|nr:hypothetical protein [Gammaproteobacteria bacterium]
MLRKITHTAISMLAMAIICVSAVDARGRQSAPRRPNGVRNLDGPPRLGQGGHPERGLAQLDLTEEQQPAIRERVEELKETGASREEIHAAVAEMLEGFGVEVPERRIGRVGHILEQLDLTDEQRQTVLETISEMKAAGATPEGIRPAVIELLEGFGIEIPENLGEGPGPGLHRRPGPGRGLSQLDLTDEQRQAVRDRIAEMKEAEATREEVHAAVVELLEGLGVEIPEN